MKKLQHNLFYQEKEKILLIKMIKTSRFDNTLIVDSIDFYQRKKENNSVKVNIK